MLGGLSALVVPAMVEEFDDLRDNLPEYAQDLEDFLADFGIEAELSDPARDIDWDNLISGQAAVDYGQRALAVLLARVDGDGSHGVSARRYAAPISLSISVRAARPRAGDGALPDAAPTRGGRLHPRTDRDVGVHLYVYTLVVLLIVDVPNALAFAVLAAFVDIIPLVGATIAVVFPTMAAFQESPEQAIIVLALLMLYQQFEDRFLTPRVYGQTLNLPPLVVLVAVLAGGQLLGIVGVLLAMPAAAIARVGFDYWMERRGPAYDPNGPIRSSRWRRMKERRRRRQQVAIARGVGKCEEDHPGSYGYPTRPEEALRLLFPVRKGNDLGMQRLRLASSGGQLGAGNGALLPRVRGALLSGGRDG